MHWTSIEVIATPHHEHLDEPTHALYDALRRTHPSLVPRLHVLLREDALLEWSFQMTHFAHFTMDPEHLVAGIQTEGIRIVVELNPLDCFLSRVLIEMDGDRSSVRATEIIARLDKWAHDHGSGSIFIKLDTGEVMEDTGFLEFAARQPWFRHLPADVKLMARRRIQGPMSYVAPQD